MKIHYAHTTTHNNSSTTTAVNANITKAKYITGEVPRTIEGNLDSIITHYVNAGY